MLLVRTSHSIPATQKALQHLNEDYTLFEVSNTTPQSLNLPAHSNVILTSTAAIPSLVKAQSSSIVHCINTTTADAAEKEGLTIGLVGNSNAAALAELICTSKAPPLLFHHLTTSTAETNWYTTLIERGHAIQRHTAYNTDYAQSLTPKSIAAIQQHVPILLFSAKSARHLLFLTNRANISTKQCNAHVISSNVAKVCENHFKEIHIANKPTLTDVLKTL